MNYFCKIWKPISLTVPRITWLTIHFVATMSFVIHVFHV